SSDWTISTFQSKKTLMSAEPRAVVERILVEPGISFIASSMGLVIVAIISSAGMTPLSMRMTTRGKFVCGKTDEGMVMAEKAPARQRARITKMMLFEWWVARLPTKEDLFMILRRSWVDLFLDVDFGFFGQAVGAFGDDHVAVVELVGFDFGEACFAKADVHGDLGGLVTFYDGDDGFTFGVGDDGITGDG